MIGLKSIASYVPLEGVDNYAQGAKFGKDQDFIFGKIGSTFLPRKDEHQETSDLGVAAARNLFAANPALDPASIDVVIVVTQNGDAEGLPHTAAIVQHKLGLSTAVAAFDVSLGCSGYVYGLYAMKGFMEATGLRNGLLITADPYSKIVDPEDRNTTMLFGDAATATWMGEDAPWQLGKSLFGSDGAGAEHLRTTDGTFFMNGRQVYNFALVKVPAHLHQLLEASGLSAEQIDLYCLHQAARPSSMRCRRGSRTARTSTSSSRTCSRPATRCRPASRCCWKNTCSARRCSVWRSAGSEWACRGARRFSNAKADRLSVLPTPLSPSGVLRQALRPLVLAVVRGKSLISRQWQPASNFFANFPKATRPDDDNYYEGSLCHARRSAKAGSRSTHTTRNSSWL